MQKARRPRAYAVISAMAAAARKQNDGNDDQPKGAVFKQIAKAVIHNRSSKKSLEELRGLLCYHIMTKAENGERNLSAFADFWKSFSIFTIFQEHIVNEP